MKRKSEFIKWLDEKDQRSGIAEVVSDLAISAIVNAFESKVYPLLPDWAKQAIDNIIDGLLDGQSQSKGGETPPDPDPDK